MQKGIIINKHRRNAHHKCDGWRFWPNGWQQHSFVFLMDDGAVEYIPIERALKEGFCSYGKIKDVDGVISLQQTYASTGCEGGSLTVAALKANGEFYDLHTKLEDMNSWKQKSPQDKNNTSKSLCFLFGGVMDLELSVQDRRILYVESVYYIQYILYIHMIYYVYIISVQCIDKMFMLK